MGDLRGSLPPYRGYSGRQSEGNLRLHELFPVVQPADSSGKKVGTMPPLNMAPSITHSLPKNVSEWTAAAEKEGVLDKTLSAFDALPSPSKMTIKEYLAMRVLRPSRKKADKIPVNKALEDRTQDMLSGFHAFDHYIAHIAEAKKSLGKGDGNIGAFQLARDSQLQALGHKANASDLARTAPPIFRPRSSQDPSSQPDSRSQPAVGSSTHLAVSGAREAPSPAAAALSPSSFALSASGLSGTATTYASWIVPSRSKDEQIVNEALTELLRALTLNIPDIACRWTSARRPFATLQFGQVELTACTDGYLEGIGVDETFAIVEAKAAGRDRRRQSLVLWQEAAEMVAWIMTDTNSRQCPLDK
ncbi:uncharacterized protein N7515_003758 [Penicillium bovifimosum]|uniref:Uncharacterized protein n=1 Tax=Penicillium bovifimosum TaxID=126998 RepID=A0A9W9H5B0_9EURO|nr:uncharacterized protein N7515_003758 [Penicillium bovifimosum]KAJ5138910.1 hypothetical protein N7515_003758 [Penicillium bovifimosum]